MSSLKLFLNKQVTCKICRSDVPYFNIDLDNYIWECYDCQDSHIDSAENFKEKEIKNAFTKQSKRE